MVLQGTQRRLAAILATDMVGFSRLIGIDEEGTLARQKAHRNELIDPMIEAYGGRIVKSTGDGLLVEFPSVVDAARCAVTVQLAMPDREAQVPEDVQITYRIGINLGDIVVDGDDIYGDGVNIAARLEGLADPGGICISRAVFDQVKGKLNSDFEDLGFQQVKNIAEPIQVHRVQMQPEAAPAVSATTAEKPRRRRWAAITAAVVLTVAIAGVLYWESWAPDFEPASVANMAYPLPDKPSIAVLPFDNMSDDQAQEYFADGLTDDLITDLSKVSGLFVIARNSVFTFKGRTVRIEEVAEDLGVRYILEGSVRRAGDRIRVNAQLVEGSTGHHIWAERYDREITDLFAVQDELIGQIVSALAVRLTTTEEAQLIHRPIPEFEAYELYLKAREGYFSRDQVRMRESLDLYTQATAIDPTFARAYAGLAQLAADMWRLSSVRGLAGGVAKKTAEDAAQRALDLDPTLADARSVLALLRLTEGDHDAALQMARRALALDPNSADAHTTLGIVLGYAGQPEAALESIRTAVRLNPRPPPYLTTYYGWTLFLNRRYEEAIAVLEPIAGTRDRALGDSPREILAMAYAESGLLDEAHAQVESLLEQETFPSLAWYRAAYGYHAREEDLQYRLDALRKAGMPEWPLGIQGDPEQRVSGPELQNLITGKTWSGTDAGRRAEFIQEFGVDDDVVYAGPESLLSGAAFIRGEELCEQFEGFTRGLEFCGPVYRNSAGTAGERNEYLYVNPLTIRYFSLTQ